MGWRAMGEGMRYEVTLKRKQTISSVQNMRRIRTEVSAESTEEAKETALKKNNNEKYFIVESVRRL